MPQIRVIFSDTKAEVVSYFEDLQVKGDYVELMDVRTYVDYQTPHIEETGCDFDGDVVYTKIGIIYFEAVDRIEIIKDEDKKLVIFEKTA